MLIVRSVVFAIEAVILISRSQDWVRMSDIAGQLGVDRRKIEGLMQELTARGVLVGQRGPGGGYLLGRPLPLITVGDVVLAFEALSERLNPGREGTRGLPTLWDSLAADIEASLGSLPLTRYAELTRRAAA